jgi:hypothetical protein
MAISYPYDVSYDPAAPVIEIGIGPSGEASRVKRMAFVDTGADATMIPRNILKAARGRYVQQRGLRGVTGSRMTANL